MLGVGDEPGGEAYTVPMFCLRVRRLLLLSIALLLPSATASADAWTQREGACYAKLSARGIFGSTAYLGTGLRDSRENVVDYRDVQAQLYAECGLHPQLTALVFGVPLGYADAGRDTAYIGPLGVGVRLDPIGDAGPVRFALQANYAFAPDVGATRLFDEAGAAPPVFYQPALENHYGELSAQLGGGFVLSEDVNGWIVGTFGLRFSSAAGVDPALVGNAQMGLTVWSWLQVEAHFPLYEPFFQSIVETNIAGVGQTRYLGFGVSASLWFLPELAVNAGVDGVFYASSNAATPSLTLGLESRFSAWSP